MRFTPRRPLIMILLIAAMLIVLLGGSLGIEATSGTQSAHSLAWYCPAPPVTC